MLFSFFLLTFNLLQAILKVPQCRQYSCIQIQLQWKRNNQFCQMEISAFIRQTKFVMRTLEKKLHKFHSTSVAIAQPTNTYFARLTELTILN